MPRTILVTGATGYIAKHIVLRLLERGDTVVGSVRRRKKAEALREAMKAHLSDPGKMKNLKTVVLDLSGDDNWDKAMVGVDAVLHTASPFPISMPDDETEVIRPAVDGALRALRAAKAAGVRRVVMTSSTVAVSAGVEPSQGATYTEADWSDPEADISAYAKSKTLAERAAWDFAETEGGIDLTCINPVFVQGAPLDSDYGTSIRVVTRILAARDPAMPRMGFPTVDVGDVAEAHIRALDRPESIGKRFIVSDRFLWFREIGEEIKAAVPGRKIKTREAPNFVIRFLSIFDSQIRTIVPELGRHREASNALARDVLGLEFRDARESIRETARWLVEVEGR